MTDLIQHKLALLPNSPGVYQFFDEAGKIIYVGKAKSLKNRVQSYFQKSAQHSGKTRVLVKHIRDLKTIKVPTEYDALFLENSFIKEFQPKYNILLKDDKTYPWICIKKERFPRIFATRKMIKNGSQYFGPYASVKVMRNLLELIAELFPLRNCHYDLSAENIHLKKFRACLEYQIGKCNAPCIANESEEEYMQTIKNIKHIIQGHLSVVRNHFKNLMYAAAEKFEFEEADRLKQKIALLEKFQSKSIVISNTTGNVEVYAIQTDEKIAVVHYMKIIEGAVVQSINTEIKKKLDESDKDILIHSIIDLRERFSSDCKEVLVPFDLSTPFVDFKATVPLKGDKKNLLDLANRNIKFYVLEKKKSQELIDPNRHSNRILEQLKKDLRLTEIPKHIECFDNSNFQGSFPVAACVVFKNAKPSKKDYRHFNIKTVEGPDDFASMEEVVKRRYARLLTEKKALPQLIVVDGGKGQLSSAYKALKELKLNGKIAIIGIAKKLEEIYFPSDSIPLHLDKRSESLKLIQNLRNEAHRFGITHHRGKRIKANLQSELLNIKGIGSQTAEELLSHFGSVKRIKEADISALEAQVGKSKAQLIYDFFRTKLLND